MKIFFLILSINSLLSCAAPVRKSDELIPTTAMTGHYVWGFEVNTFQPCGSDKTYWVEGTDSSVKELERKYRSLTKKPFEKTFATVSGKIGGKDPNSDGFDAEYDGLITIEKIHSLTGSSSTDCK